VSEISITRFQPAPAVRGKVNSVEATDNDLDANQSEHLPQKQHHEGGRDQQGSNTAPATAEDNSRSDKPSKSAASATSPADEELLEQAVSRLNTYIQSVKRDLLFDIDPLSQEPMVTVVDRESRKVLRQFDGKEALEMARKVDSEEPISLFKTRV